MKPVRLDRFFSYSRTGWAVETVLFLQFIYEGCVGFGWTGGTKYSTTIN